MNEEAMVTQEERIPQPQISIDNLNGKPYYSIKYYNPFDKTFHIGFSSYCIENVEQWLSEDFISIPMVDIENIIKQIQDREKTCTCWESGQREAWLETGATYCQQCGKPLKGE